MLFRAVLGEARRGAVGKRRDSEGGGGLLKTRKTTLVVNRVNESRVGAPGPDALNGIGKIVRGSKGGTGTKKKKNESQWTPERNTHQDRRNDGA